MTAANAAPSLARMSRNRSSARPVRAPKARPGSRPSGGQAGRLGWLTPRRTFLAVIALAAAIAGILIGISVAGSGGGASSASRIEGAQATTALLAGIPQKGNVLGRPDAPATLVEFAEPQCPICRLWATETFPTIVRSYVRPGKLRIVFQGLVFIRPTSDSDNALRAMIAAGRQNRMFNFLDLLYRNQGREGSGWVSDDLLRSIGKAIPGLDVEKMMAGRSSPATSRQIASSANAAAQVMGTQVQTPTFLAGKRGGSLQLVQIQSRDQLYPAGFRALLDRLIAG